MRVQHIDYQLRRGRRRITLPEVEVWVCDTCGERVFPYESSQKIEAYKLYSGRFNLRIDPLLHAQLVEQARKNNRSLNQEITHLLKRCL